MTTLSKIGEAGWLDLVRNLCAPGAAGDDAAVLRGGREDLLFTADMILEGKHFRLKDASAYEIGWKAMAVNLSDIAAMGGTPVAATVSLGAPRSARVSFLKELYRGLSAAASRFGAAVVGGDTDQSPRWVVSVALLGRVPKGRALLRSSARTGDMVFVSGRLGGSYSSRKHLKFIPRIREAQWLSRRFRVHAMMDLSDGLSTDLGRMAAASGVSVLLEEGRIPVSRGASLKAALNEGEDFELLFTLPQEAGRELMRARRPAGFPVFTPIGRVTGRGKTVGLLRRSGRVDVLTAAGFDHFR